MKNTFFSIVLLLGSISSGYADNIGRDACPLFPNRPSQRDCMDATKTNENASYETVKFCLNYIYNHGLGLQHDCFNTIKYTPNVQVQDLQHCLRFDTFQGQADCLTNLCPHHNFFGSCE